MITAYSFKKAQEAIKSAKQQIASEMPNASMVFTSADNEKIYFNVVAKLNEINEQQIKDLEEKTRFGFISNITEPFLKAECFMFLE